MQTGKSSLPRLLAVVLGLALLVPSLAACGVPRVPNVVGKSQIEAVRLIEAAGYKVGDIHSVYSSNVPKDFVAATNPPAGAKARKGSKIDVSVNSGSEASIVVPDLVGQGETAAKQGLTSIDLVPVVAESYNPTITAGEVMGQVPAPASKVVGGSQVVIQVSKGPAPKKVAVPSVAGKSQSDAESAIEKAGLTVKAYKVYSDSVAKGKVIGQSPEGGAKVNAGSEVGIAVSLGKGTGAVTLPNVVGKKEADAVNSLKSAGLKPKVYRQYSDTVAAGVVVAQLPAAGTTAASGAEVGISVSMGPEATSGNVAVPDVLGKTQVDASSALESAGFVVQAVQQPSSAPSGTVAAQLPVGGSTAPAGSTIIIAISSGS